MGVKKGLLLEGTKWYGVRWEKGTVIERGGKNCYGIRSIVCEQIAQQGDRILPKKTQKTK